MNFRNTAKPKATRRSRVGKSICPGMDGIRTMQEQLSSEASDTRGPSAHYYAVS